MPQRFYRGGWWPLQDLPFFCKFPWSHPGGKEVGLYHQLLSRWLSFRPPTPTMPLHLASLWPPAAGKDPPPLSLEHLPLSTSDQTRNGTNGECDSRRVTEMLPRAVMSWCGWDMVEVLSLAKEAQPVSWGTWLCSGTGFYTHSSPGGDPGLPHGLALKAAMRCTSGSWGTGLQLISPCQGVFKVSRASWVSPEHWA